MPNDIFDEFDAEPAPSELELSELGLPLDVELDACLVPPETLEAQILDPASGELTFGGEKLSKASLPTRLKAFYRWLDLGDLVKVANEFNLKVSVVKRLFEQDQWLARAEQLRVNLDGSLRVLFSESKRRGMSLLMQYIGALDPERLARESGPADFARMVTAMANLERAGHGAGQSVVVQGDAQIVAQGSQGQQNLGGSGSRVDRMSDAELMAEAERLGLRVQPAPNRRARGEVDPPLPDAEPLTPDKPKGANP